MIVNLTRVFRDAGVQRGDAIHFAIDVSGMPPTRTIYDMLDILADACDNLQVYNVTIYQFDTVIRYRSQYANGSFDLVRKISLICSGGGTLIKPVLDEFSGIPFSTSPRFFVATDGLFSPDRNWFLSEPIHYLVWGTHDMSLHHLPRWVSLETE